MVYASRKDTFLGARITPESCNHIKVVYRQTRQTDP